MRRIAMFLCALGIIAVSSFVLTSKCNAAPICTQDIIFDEANTSYVGFCANTLIEADNGDALCFAQGRYGTGDTADSDIILKRSTNGGVTWESLQVVQAHNNSQHGHPTPVKNDSGDIYVFYNEDWGVDYVYYKTSTDNGITWSDAVNVRSTMTGLGENYYCCTPGGGKGLTLSSGRMVVPFYAVNEAETYARNFVIYSDNGGDTWEMGGILTETNKNSECRIVLLDNGSTIYMNSRTGTSGTRSEAYSTNGGITWTTPTHDTQFTGKNCDAGLTKYDSTTYLYSNPVNTLDRSDLTVKTSYDNTSTFSQGKLICDSQSGYSDLLVLSDVDKTILLSYEEGPGPGACMNHVKVARFNMEWLLEHEIIIDNVDSGFSTDSTWSTSTAKPGYYGINYAHDGTSGTDATKWAKWTPNITNAGNYKIYMQWSYDGSRPDAAPLEIKYNGGSSTDTSETVDQTVNRNGFYYIGTYYFASGTGNYVKILCTDAGYTCADAVMFEKTD